VKDWQNKSEISTIPAAKSQCEW